MTPKSPAELVQHFERCIAIVERRIAERDTYIANKQADITNLIGRIRLAEQDIDIEQNFNQDDRRQLPGLHEALEANRRRADIEQRVRELHALAVEGDIDAKVELDFIVNGEGYSVLDAITK